MQYFTYYALVVSSTLTVYFIVYSISLIKFKVVVPIQTLYNHVMNPEDTRAIDNFITGLKKREYDRIFRREAEN